LVGSGSFNCHILEWHMSIIDKVVAAVTPPESEEARIEARAKAERLARPGDWLSQILDHHRGIQAQLVAVKNAATAAERVVAQKQLAVLLAGHAIAEEMAIYPAMAGENQPGHAEIAYQEQSAAKMELGLLEKLDPLSEDYLDKLKHIEGAVTHHIYAEESTWFPQLVEASSPAEHEAITARYSEEYDRYIG
jgi:hemerythrin superfamily protein